MVSLAQRTARHGTVLPLTPIPPSSHPTAEPQAQCRWGPGANPTCASAQPGAAGDSVYLAHEGQSRFTLLMWAQDPGQPRGEQAH